ncbi:DUF488 family protein [Phytoactinopolyspora alkaliphila]|nr:DUF488 domain-containing protein [Phytoactinopolyspora alkaliphila]
MTVGHGARSAEEFVAVLLDAGVGTLVDVRRFPGSRRHPQFGREALATTLRAHGIRYEWQGESLGGRRRRSKETRHMAILNESFGGYADHMDTPEFRDALTVLLRRAEGGERLAVMCAETLWWRCHRSFIADALICRGSGVVHLTDVGQRRHHRPKPIMRCDDDAWPVYDVPDTLPIDGEAGRGPGGV